MWKKYLKFFQFLLGILEENYISSRRISNPDVDTAPPRVREMANKSLNNIQVFTYSLVATFQLWRHLLQVAFGFLEEVPCFGHPFWGFLRPYTALILVNRGKAATLFLLDKTRGIQEITFYLWRKTNSMPVGRAGRAGCLGYTWEKTYRKTSNISRTLVGKKIVDNSDMSDVVGASPVGAAPTTSSFST